MNKDVTILIIDDHPAMAFGTKIILENIPGVRVTGMAGNGERGLALMAQERPDIVFLDFNLPDLSGMEVAERMKALDPDVHIVIFSGIDIVPMINKLLELRVSGIMSKDSGEEQIKNMIRCILEGQTAIPLALFHQMLLSKPEEDRSPLTEEEDHIMSLILKGATNEQIADVIHMSKRSVDNYVRKIYDKFGVKSRAQAIERYLNSKK
jgi:two-component system competent response regulator ComA